jgi:serine/threonine protein kinase
MAWGIETGLGLGGDLTGVRVRTGPRQGQLRTCMHLRRKWQVHLGQDKLTGRPVAIKTIEKDKALAHHRGLVSLEREIETLRRIRHRSVIQLFAVFENELYVHLILEPLEGGTMVKYLTSKGRYSEKDASIAIRQVLEALDYCHGLNIAHRDLKPDNLLLMYDNRVIC